MRFDITSNTERSALQYYDDLRYSLAQQSPILERSDVISVAVEDNNTGSEDKEMYDLRHLASFIGVKSDSRQLWIDSAAASLLAIHHFNNRDTSVVPEIAAASDTCDIKFTMEFIDTEHQIFVASSAFANDILPRKAQVINAQQPLPTALIGAIYSSVSSALATLSGVNDIPQLSPASTAGLFDNKVQFPLFARLIPSNAADAVVAVDYLVNKLGVTHCGILYMQNTYGVSYFNDFMSAAGHSNPPLNVVSSSMPEDPTEKDFSNALRPLIDSEYNYFFGVIYDQNLENFMIHAYREKIAGNGKFWMFGEGSGDISYRSDVSPEFIAALHGSVHLIVANEQQIIDQRDSLKSFMSAWEQEVISSPEMLQYLKEKIPGNITGLSPSAIPLHYTLVAYDSVIAAALAACEAKSNTGTVFSGKDLYKELLDVNFRGTFGTVTFDPKTGGRGKLNLPYIVKNILEDRNDSNNAFLLQTADLYEEKSDGSGAMEWRSISPLTFSDNTTTPPESLPPPDIEHKTISTAALAFGYFFCGMIILLSLCFGAWSIYHRKNSVIKKSQPFFLVMLCTGTIIMGLTIIPMSLLEPMGEKNLDAACQSKPWLFSTGFIIIFSALYSKTDRVYRLFRKRTFRRLKVTTMDVMKPFITLFSLNFILLALWTALDPTKYKRVYSDTSFDRHGRSLKLYGTCTSDGTTSNVFLALIATLDIAVLIIANYKAYQTRSVATEFSESQFIALSMASILQVVLFGTPILFLDNSEIPTAKFLIQSLLILVICLAVLILIFVPKVFYLREWKKEQEIKKRKKEEKRKRNETFFDNVAHSRLHEGRTESSGPRVSFHSNLVTEDNGRASLSSSYSSGGEGLKIQITPTRDLSNRRLMVGIGQN